MTAIKSSTAQTPSNHKVNYGYNMVTGMILANNGGKGMGLQYERIADKNDRISLLGQVATCFSTVRRSSSGHYPGSSGMGKDITAVMVFLTPGFRFYPTGSSGVTRYSIGANLMVGIGKGEGSGYTNGTNVLEERSIAGILITNSISSQIGKVRAGLELDLGVGADSRQNNPAGKIEGATPMVQLSFSLGYRW